MKLSHSKTVAVSMSLAAMSLLAAACGSSSTSTSTSTSKAPADITIGTTYAATGAYATASMPEFDGLKLWIKLENKKGGVYVGAYHKRIPLKLIAYNDQSSAATASVLYNQLITQNKVNIFVSDFGSVLTAPAVAVGQAHKQLVFDPSGTGIPFFTPNNPYIVLTSLPESSIWPTPLAQFIGAKKIKNVAIVYDSNDFDQSQAETLKSKLTAEGVRVSYYQAVPTSTTSYGTIINSMKATNPGAVLEFGFQPNDTAFLGQLQSSGIKFPMTFTVFPGQLFSLFKSQLGKSGLQYTYTYATNYSHNYTSVSEGLTSKALLADIHTYYPSASNAPGLLGYNAGLVVQAALKNATSLSQLALRNALTKVSGSLNTVDGNFKINSEGAQVGELLPVGQILPTSTSVSLKVVYPAAAADASAVYPAP
ncbi:leucine-specific-binding protein precursor [Ferrimicrobium acidiphilum DSM 19497]|uniref:Leucine-specific-binding protein n=2 Tax=Ferrimicrobium acidiphilum TaxID=121039 RepID=A0A0D8FQH3_9ACTN|nr:leucine-specific-binding protein precursor [Ferrimicrobium acidiphilum DSM 19497]